MDLDYDLDYPCCDYRDHGGSFCTCPDHEQDALHPFGTPSAAHPLDKARSLLGRQVVVTLGDQDGEKVLARGRLLTCADSGGFTLKDDMGFIHYCWPLLDIAGEN
jgi:hypothetical protein